MAHELDRATLTELLAYDDWLRALARSLVADPVAAEDVAQEVWRRALTSPPRHTRQLAGWLRRATRNVIATRASKRAATRDREASASRTDALPSTESLVQRASLQRRLVRAVLDLAEPYRSTVLHCYFDERSPKELAERLGIPSATVRGRLARALDQLRDALAEEQDGGGRGKLAVVLAPLLAGASTDMASVRRAALFAGIGVVLLVVPAWIWLGRDRVAPPLARHPLAAAVESAGPRRSVPEASLDATVAALDPALDPAPIRRHELLVFIATYDAGSPTPRDLTFEVTRTVAGHGASVPFARPVWPDTPPPGFRARGRSNEVTRIAVNDPGSYDIMVRIEGVRNDVPLTVAADSAGGSTAIEIWPAVRVETAGVRARRARVVYRLRPLDETEMLPARPVADGWMIDGPIASSLRVGLDFGDGTPTWWYKARAPSVRLDLPETETIEVACRDAATGLPVSGVRGRLHVRSTSAADWEIILIADAIGVLRVPRLAPSWAGRASGLVLRAPGYVDVHLSQLPVTLARVDGGARARYEVPLPPVSSLGGRLEDSSGGPAVAAAVVVCAGSEPVFHGVTDDQGRIQIDRAHIASRGEVWRDLDFRRPPAASFAAFIWTDRVRARLDGDWDDFLSGRWIGRLPPARAAELEVIHAATGEPVRAHVELEFAVDGRPARLLDGDGPVGETDETGIVDLPPLAGPWRVRVGALGFRDELIALGEDDVHEVKLRPASWHRMVVADERGQPVRLATVSWWPIGQRDATRRVLTDHDGAVWIGPLERDVEPAWFVRAHGRMMSLATTMSLPVDGVKEVTMVPVVTARIDPRGPDGASPARALLLRWAVDDPSADVSYKVAWSPESPRVPLTRERQNITIHAVGYRSARVEWSPAAAEVETTIPIPLLPGFDVQGTVALAGGVSGARAHLSPRVDSVEPLLLEAGIFAASTVPVIDGAFRFDPVTPGAWQLAILGDDGAQLVLRMLTVDRDLTVDFGAVGESESEEAAATRDR